MPAKNYYVLPGVEWVNGKPVPPHRVVLLTDDEAEFDLEQGRIVLGTTQPPVPEPDPPLLPTDKVTVDRSGFRRTISIDELVSYVDTAALDAALGPTLTLDLSRAGNLTTF